MTESDPRPYGPDIRGWVVPDRQHDPNNPRRFFLQRRAELLRLVAAELAATGYNLAELDGLELREAVSLALRAAAEYKGSGVRLFGQAADHLAEAADMLTAARELAGFTVLGNILIREALGEFAQARALIAEAAAAPGGPVPDLVATAAGPQSWSRANHRPKASTGEQLLEKDEIRLNQAIGYFKGRRALES